MQITTRKKASLGLSRIALPWIRNELPAWGHVTRLAGLGFKDRANWADAGWRRLTLKDCQYDVWLDLSASFDRGTFFLGRYQELELQLVIQRAIGADDQFIDGGANIGLLSLFAARIVGDAGCVHAFEPNPKVFQRLSEHVEMNGLKNLFAHKVGLSNEAAELKFRVLDGGSESGTLANLSDKLQSVVTEETTVQVVRGDDQLANKLSSKCRAMIKLDVEGFEAQAVEGLIGTIDALRPVITTEYQHHLMKPDDVTRLFDLLGVRDYRAFKIGLSRKNGFAHELELMPIGTAEALTRHQSKCDILWLDPSSVGRFEDVINP